MLKENIGRVDNIEQNIICIQVNSEGMITDDIGIEIASRYKKVNFHLKLLCKSYNYDYEKLKAKPMLINVDKQKWVCACFTQNKNYQTDVKILRKCFKELIDTAIQRNLTIAVPIYYGCEDHKERWQEIRMTLSSISQVTNTVINIINFDNYDAKVVPVKKETIEPFIKPIEIKKEPEQKKIQEGKKMETTKKTNSLGKLNDILFDQINRLISTKDDTELREEITKSYAIGNMSQKIINNANLYIKALELAVKNNISDEDLPEVLRIKHE